MIHWPPKDPAEAVAFGFDWKRVLGTDTISSSSFVKLTGDAVLSAPGYTATTASARISGGTAGTSSTFRNTITTVAGNTYSEVGVVDIKDNAATS